jgi:hypothetical protein
VNTDIEIKNLKAEIKRGHDAIDEMRRSGKEPDDVERAGLNLLDLSEKLEMSELRQELDKSALALRMMKFKGAGIEEQEMSMMKMRQMERSFNSMMQSRDVNRQRLHADFEIRILEKKGRDPRELELARLQRQEVELNGASGDIQKQMEDIVMDMENNVSQMKMQRADQRDIDFAAFKIRGVQLDFKKKQVDVQLKKEELEIKRMELKGADSREIEARKAALRMHVLMHNEVDPLREDIERAEMDLKIMLSQGRDHIRETCRTRLDR